MLHLKVSAQNNARKGFRLNNIFTMGTKTPSYYEPETRVFKKPSNYHQYVEYSSCLPGSCISEIPFSQAKRYRRITSKKDQFINDCNYIREHFKNRNYPDSVVDQAIAKAAQLSTDEALQPTTKMTLMLFLLFALLTHLYQT